MSEAEFPLELEDLLATNPEAKAVYEGLVPSHRREYVRWIAEARQEVTRRRRAEQAVGMLLEKRS
jgi:uncharacterized protein YdeI (YjbR/CyaY-like superfamily)